MVANMAADIIENKFIYTLNKLLQHASCLFLDLNCL